MKLFGRHSIVIRGIKCIIDHGIIYTTIYGLKKIWKNISFFLMKRGILQPHVSIIIPIYNASSFIESCVDSFLKQSDPCFELICVDDGSTDNTLSILHEYEIKDSRVVVLTQSHGFAGIARNLGMSIAKGRYLYFSDSDDFAEETLVEKAYTTAMKNKADIVYFGANIFDHQSGKYHRPKHYLDTSLVPINHVFSGTEYGETILRFSTLAPWNKLFKKSFIEDQKLQFRGYRHANDIGFTMPAAALAKRIVVIADVLYHLRRNHGGNLCATREVAPRLFYTAFCDVKKTLMEKGVYAAVEKSFVSQAMTNSLFELDSLKESDIHDAIEKEFIMEMRYTLGIAPRPKDYYAGCVNFSKYTDLINKYDTSYGC